MLELWKVASRTFVLLQADWPGSKGRELIEALQPSHVIIRRNLSDRSYYLLSTEESFELFSLFPTASLIQDVLDLSEKEPTPTLEGTVNAEDAPDRCVILVHGRLWGFFDATAFSTSGTRHGVSETPSMFGELQMRSLQTEFPEQVMLGESPSLLVSLSTALLREKTQPMNLPIGATVDIVVQARRGFVFEGRNEGKLVIIDQEETLPIQFKMRATELGTGEIRVIAFHEGIALGVLTLTPTVIATSQGLFTRLSSPYEQPLALVNVRLPDLSLFIEEAWVGNMRAFSLRISALDHTFDLNLTKFGPISFQIDPGPYFQGFYRDIEAYSISTHTERAITAQRLANKGEFLFKTLFPVEARNKLWSLRNQIKSVLIQSEEPWIPWELCKLSGEEDGQIVEGPFFCEAFAITRWIPGLGLKPNLKLQNLALVVPSDSDLPFAAVERDYLLSLAGNGRQVTQVPARFLALHRALRAGIHDCWHFTGHGGYRASDPNRSSVYLESGESFSPENLVGVVTNLGKTAPLIFLNACQIGRSGLSLTDIGGWAEQFLAAGASAFIGAYWSVYDLQSCDFTREIYSRLLVGVPIGRAVQEARIAIRVRENPTWLAYTVFADPFATVEKS